MIEKLVKLSLRTRAVIVLLMAAVIVVGMVVVWALQALA